MHKKLDGRMEKDKNFEVLSCNIKALVGNVMQPYLTIRAGSRGGREDDSEAELLSVVALMWAEDKVRWEIGMPAAQWGEKKRAGDRRMRTGKKELEDWRKIQTFSELKKKISLAIQNYVAMLRKGGKAHKAPICNRVITIEIFWHLDYCAWKNWNFHD